MPDRHEPILLTGATGHIGGRLLHRLQEADRPLRCLTRRPHELVGQIAGSTQIATGDVLDPESLAVAMRDVRTAYYLVHSMGASGDFKELDRRAAANFADAARDAGVARIIYLGGLGSGDDLSEHLASRHEVGGILRTSGVATIERALAAEDRELTETHWSQALASGSKSRLGGAKHGRRMVSSRAVRVNRRANIAFGPIERIGGATGWYALNWFWTLRGLLDELRGGVGLRRGRRDPHELRVGDAVDFWRAEHLEPGSRLLLSAEMKIPGRLWLEFEVKPGHEGSRIHQTTVFDPAGYVGRAYWYLLYPVHSNIFRAMLHGLRRATIAAPDHAG